MAKKLCISVCGGGALGIGPLAFMCRLEQDLGKSLSTLSSAFAGTSTGSIIAACLDEGMSAHDIYDLYRKNLKKIFTKYSWYKRLQPSCPTYDSSNLKKLLKENLKGYMPDWKKPIFIPTTFMNGPSVEKVWDLGDTGVEKWFAVLTSCSAPTYFDVVERNGHSYCDGGMWGNDPVMTLTAGLKKSGWGDFKILTLNTGMKTPNTDKGNKTLLGWGEYILDNWIARSGDANNYEAESCIGASNLFRATPSVKHGYKMDSVDDKTLDEVVKIWQDYYETVRKELLAFVKR